jgi:hypothetical protein
VGARNLTFTLSIRQVGPFSEARPAAAARLTGRLDLAHLVLSTVLLAPGLGVLILRGEDVSGNLWRVMEARSLE